jgi:glycosyltransferase involved in cell wall biosynthesis
MQPQSCTNGFDWKHLEIIFRLTKVLFLSPNAHMGGSQVLLLNLAKALHQSGQFEIEFLLKDGGQLKKRFEALAKTYLLNKPVLKKSLKQRIKSAFFKNRSVNNVSEIKWKNYDCILSNTITNGDVLDEIRKYYKGPILSYIHELQVSAQTFSNGEDVERVIELTDQFLVPCDALAFFLQSSFKVPENKINILPYYFPALKQSPHSIGDLKTHFIVAGIGTTDWRKAPDIFIQVAGRSNELKPDSKIKFIWKGSDLNSLEHAKIQYDIDKLGLSDIVYFESSEQELDTFLETVDLFLLTSREDPYPLVVLQAANHNIPVICFKDSGGIPEFVANSKGGISVGYLNINEAAKAVIDFYDNPDRKQECGNNAKRYLLERHQDISEFSKKLLDAIRKVN